MSKEKVLDNSEPRITVTQGVRSAAQAYGISASSDDRELRDVAKLCGGTLAQEEIAARGSLSDEERKSVYVHYVRTAYAEVQRYQAWLREDDKRNRLRKKRDAATRLISASNLRKHVYRKYRKEEHTLVRRWVFGSVISAAATLSMLLSLVAAYTPLGNGILTDGNSDIVVTISAHGGSVRQVLVGQARKASEITEQTMRSAQVPNNTKFEMKFGAMNKPSSMKIVVHGEGMIGCRIEMGGKILMNNVVKYQEATCQISQ